MVIDLFHVGSGFIFFLQGLHSCMSDAGHSISCTINTKNIERHTLDRVQLPAM